MKKKLLASAILFSAFFSSVAQNSCAEAADFNIGGTTTVGNIDGVYEGLADACPNINGLPSAVEWYKITATETGSYRINTNLEANEGGDTRISVYIGECGDLVCYKYDDNIYYASPGYALNNVLTDFQIPVTEGNTYYVAFENTYSSDGFDVEVSFKPLDCPSYKLEEDWTNSSNWYYGCWQLGDFNGDGATWGYYTKLILDYDGNEDYFIHPTPVVVLAAPQNGQKQDLLLSHELNLTAGEQYTFNVLYNGADAADNNGNTVPANENFTAAIFNGPLNTLNLVEEIGNETGIVATMGATGYYSLKLHATQGSYTFTPEEDGMYRFGIVGYSAVYSGALMIFEISMDGLAGTDDLFAPELTVFPNPATNEINVSITGDNAIIGVRLTDFNGRTVKDISLNSVTEASVIISDLAAGGYIMTVTSDKGTVIKKIVKN